MNDFNILLVEDDDDWQYLLQQDIRESVGDKPNISSHRKFGDAVKALESGISWHLLITDICLGKHGKMGKELVGLAHKSKIPTIVISGDDMVNKPDVAELVGRYNVPFFDKLLTNNIHDQIREMVRKRYEEVIQAKIIAEPRSKPANFLIISALQEEFDALKRKFSDIQPIGNDGIAYFATVDCPDKKYRLILACQFRSGQQDAASLVSILCERYKPRYVLLVGIAGGNESKVALGDIIVAKTIEDCTKGKTTGDSEWQPEWQSFNIDPDLIRKIRELPSDWYNSITKKRPDRKKRKPDVKEEGVIISGSNVLKAEKNGQWLEKIKLRNPNWLGVEMEGGGVATAIANYVEDPKPKFLMIRCVTDFADGSKGDEWHPYACDVAATYTYAFLKSGPVPALNETQSELTRAD